VAVCHERDLVRQNLDGHLNELRDAVNAHTNDITGIIDALEPLVSDDLDDPENASSPDSDSINTQFGKCLSFWSFLIFLMKFLQKIPSFLPFPNLYFSPA